MGGSGKTGVGGWATLASLVVGVATKAGQVVGGEMARLQALGKEGEALTREAATFATLSVAADGAAHGASLASYGAVPDPAKAAAGVQALAKQDHLDLGQVHDQIAFLLGHHDLASAGREDLGHMATAASDVAAWLSQGAASCSTMVAQETATMQASLGDQASVTNALTGFLGHGAGLAKGILAGL